MKSIREIVQGRTVYLLTPSMSVAEAAAYMAARKVGAVAVVDDRGLVGLFSERDLLKRVVSAGRDPRTTLIAEVMTKQLLTAEAEESFEACLARMSQAGIRHLPVMDQGKLLGMVTMRDLMMADVEAKRGELNLMRAMVAFPAPS
jgi:CBS domain-containing protein